MNDAAYDPTVLKVHEHHVYRLYRVYRVPGDTNAGHTGHAGQSGYADATSFAGHYGQLILTDGVALIPRALYPYQGALNLSPSSYSLSRVLSHKWSEDLSFQWCTELPYPSLRKMAQNTGYSERQIHRIKDGLVRAGYLRVIERRRAHGGGSGGNGNTTSAYDFSELLRTLNTLINRQISAAGKDTGKVVAVHRLLC